MNEILNDNNVIAELEEKRRVFESERRDFEEKRRELEQEIQILEQKKAAYDEDISEETKADVEEVLNKVTLKIAEITSQIGERSAKINEINETLHIEETPAAISPMSPLDPLPPLAPLMPEKSIPAESERDRKNREFEERIADCERQIEVKERELERFNERIEREIEALENRRARLEETFHTIEDKLNGNISEATRERLEDMMGEVEDKMGEIEDQMGELEDQRGEIEDEIGELQDRIEEINDEREEFEYGYVDEDVINEIKNLPGFNESVEYVKPEAVKEINIEILESAEKKYTSISNEEREKRRRFRRDSKLNVNFCAGATIDSFCCYQNRPESEGYVEHPECIISDNPGLKKKWYTEHKHVAEIGHPHWVIIDLGAVETFNYVQIIKSSEGRGSHMDTDNRRQDMSAWRIEVSNDKEDWTEFNRETNDQSTTYEKYFEPRTGRYIRLLIDAAEQDPNNKNGHVRIYGFKIKMRDEILDFSGAIHETDFTKKAKIDSFCHQHGRDERAEYMLNDNIKQKWCATDNHSERIRMPHWVIIDFGESKTFNHLRLVKASESGQDNHWDRGHRNLDMSAWRFEVSEDKETWTEFNKETNDQSSIYIKTFEPQTGRYVRLWVDAGESNPNKKDAPVRIYELRIEMTGDDLNDKIVTFDDIIAIAPFAKKETLDRLADKLTEIDNFGKVKEIGKFLSEEAINKLLLKAYEKDDFNMIMALAPFSSKDVIEKIALNFDSEIDFDKIKALAPFLGKETVAGIIISGSKVDLRKLRELAPFLGSAMIDEIVQRMF